MGLFSKLLGDVNRQLVRTATNEAIKGFQQPSSAPQPSQTVPQQASPQAAAQNVPGPSGFSWGPIMPDEENQYSYGGSYLDYFMNIYRSEFPQYQIDCKPSSNMQYVLITFSMNNQTALVVELLSKSSGVKKMRNVCGRNGIPYLRFYHNVEGWWNTRSYVITRTRSALSL